MILQSALDPTTVSAIPASYRAAAAFLSSMLVGGAVHYRYGNRVEAAVDASTENLPLALLYGFFAYALAGFLVAYGFAQLAGIGLSAPVVLVVAGVVLGGFLLTLGGVGYVVVGVAIVMTARYTMSFVVAWFREALRTYYTRDLQMRAFGGALDARIEYFDQEGSDDILNAIVTQTGYAGRAIKRVVQLTETLFLSLAYLTIVSGVIGFLIYFALHERVGPAESNLVSYFQPIVTALGAWALFGQTVSAATVLGFLGIFAGFLLVKHEVVRTRLDVALPRIDAQAALMALSCPIIERGRGLTFERDVAYEDLYESTTASYGYDAD